MSRSRAVSIALALALMLGLLAQGTLASDGSRLILKARTMVGIPDAFTGTKAPIRGINGGGLPWMLKHARVVLRSDGHLIVKVEGLVLAAGANAGSNPVNPFAAVVSCLKSDATVANVMTPTFPATTGPASAGGGNARFEGDVVLPSPCIAPIVFVTSGTGAWFASTGG
ncbi:MAG TPA: hypothetical protein VFK61_07820 [Candidatus Limnocylindria bacterium]|nr:hypothetical protein [Candidatus Limnocylindria bacterium]